MLTQYPEMAAMPDSRAERVRLAQDLLFFAYRDFTGTADVLLEEMGLGRAHHRVMHFVGRRPGMTVTGLLGILRISKQALNRVLGDLLARGYVASAPGGADRRQRLLRLTPDGEALERRLFERQAALLGPAFDAVGGNAFAGFQATMRAIVGETRTDGENDAG